MCNLSDVQKKKKSAGMSLRYLIPKQRLFPRGRLVDADEFITLRTTVGADFSDLLGPSGTE